MNNGYRKPSYKFHEGYKAYKYTPQLNVDDCGYEKDSQQYKDYVRGWNQARFFTDYLNRKKMINTNNKLKIYLSGRIIDNDKEATHGWRDKVVVELGDTYEYCDPSRHESDWKTLVERDIKWIKDSDIIICNYWKIGCGSAMELVYAKQMNKLVLTVMPNPHPWIEYHSNLTFGTLDELVSFVKRNEQYIRSTANYWKPAIRSGSLGPK